LIGCGGWSAPLLIVSYLLLDNEAQRWASVFYGLALVCNYPHYMATVHRAYARKDDRARYRLFTTYVTALLVLVAAVVHVRLELLPWLFTAYVMWSPWHYTGQNFGLTMMFLRRAGAEVTPRERQRLRVAFVASFVMLLAAFNQGTSADRLVLSIGLPRAIALTIQIGAGLVFVVSGVWALWTIAARMSTRRSLVPAITLYVTQACWFVIPIALAWMTAIDAPQTRYSSGILAVMHSAQYLWITQHYARRAASVWSGWAYWGTLIVGGVALFLPGPWLASYVGHFDFTSSMLIVTAIVNIHHFIIDGVVWKLRDPRVAQALVGSESTIQARPATAAVMKRGVLMMLTRPVVVCGLLALAALDQWRYTLASSDTDRGALETASLLNPYDGSVHMRLAKVATQTGDTIAAERALREAIAANPQDPAARRSLLRFLMAFGRLPEAYTESRAIADRWPEDVDTLINAGVLAYRLEDRRAAEEWWTRALARDARLTQVQLYLAELVDADGRPADALPHYQRYLELVVASPREEQPPPREVALVVVKLADALAHTGQQDAAAKQYDLAANIAHQTGLTDVEALAREHNEHSRR
jgi:tetratricopeptide (TPR) repeat protein